MTSSSTSSQPGRLFRKPFRGEDLVVEPFPPGRAKLVAMPNIEIDGFSEAQTSVIRRWTQDALRFLDAEDEDIRIRPFANPPYGVFAQANDEEVQLDARLLSGYLAPMGLVPAWYIGYLLYEEIAHSLLGRAGVPHETLLGTMFQKMYATWVQAAAVAAQRIPAEGVGSVPVPAGIQGRQLYYNVGKQLGAAMAGLSDNEEHLREWRQRGDADPRLATLVEEVRAELSPPLTREAVVESYRSHAR